MKTLGKSVSGWLGAGILTLASLVGIMGLGACDGGTSSETVGGIAATTDVDEIRVTTDAENEVGLYSVDFLPHLDSGFAVTARVDSKGIFTFGDLAPGRYQLLVRSPSKGMATLVTEMVIPGSGVTVRADLEPTGNLSGTITDSLTALLGFAYLPGTPFYAEGDSLMRYTLNRLPAGTHSIVKTWKQPALCDPEKICSGLETRQDSARVQIASGENAVW
jgi:hypothetical protein